MRTERKRADAVNTEGKRAHLGAQSWSGADARWREGRPTVRSSSAVAPASDGAKGGMPLGLPRRRRGLTETHRAGSVGAQSGPPYGVPPWRRRRPVKQREALPAVHRRQRRLCGSRREEALAH
jgi:hypothetical protein